MSDKEYVITYNAGVDKAPRKHVFETAQEAIELGYYYIRHWDIYSNVSIASRDKLEVIEE